MTEEEKSNASDLIFAPVFPAERKPDPQLEIDMKKLSDWMEESRERMIRKDRIEVLIMKAILIGASILVLFLLSFFGLLDFTTALVGFLVGYAGTPLFLKLRG